MLVLTKKNIIQMISRTILLYTPIQILYAFVQNNPFLMI